MRDLARTPDRISGFPVSTGDHAKPIFHLAFTDENPWTEPSRETLSEGSETAIRRWLAGCEVAGHN